MPLGHDHHQALEAALRLRRATTEDLNDAVERFREFWNGCGRRHFEIEEALVLPALQGDEEWDVLADRVRQEHELLRTGAESLDTVESAHALGQLLNDHVRFEERELFQVLEARLDPGRLSTLGREIKSAS